MGVVTIQTAECGYLLPDMFALRVFIMALVTQFLSFFKREIMFAGLPVAGGAIVFRRGVHMLHFFKILMAVGGDAIFSAAAKGNQETKSKTY